MLLQQLSVFQPAKFAYFPNSENPCAQIHPSLQYIVFSTRADELVLHNEKTGRTSNIFKSEHGIVDIKFTSDLILVIEKGYHQILCFSLKTQKLKKKITGNRTQIIKLAYCRQRGLFCAITHDSCSVYNQLTLNRQKLLKCSTSSFIDCLFNQNGKYLFTAFKDSNFFVWDMDSYKYQQYQCEGQKLKIAANYSSFVCLYNQSNIFMSQLGKQCAFQRLDKFWDSHIERVDFIQNILIIQTQAKLYIAQVYNEHKFSLRCVKAVQGMVNTFRVASYGSTILLLSHGAKKISCLQIVDQNKKVIGAPKNPLTNQGLYCCGGYSNADGCVVSDKIEMTQIYGRDKLNPQQLLSNTYNQQTVASFSQEKLQQFLKKHHIFPDKHRASAYKFMLQLPISAQQFLRIQQKGLHQCVEFLDKRYPLQNKKMSAIIKNVISWLAHVDPIFAEIQQLPQIVFPFVCLFGQDQYLCFQIVYRIMTHWLSFIFDEFPVANSQFLQNIYEILDQNDPQMINFLKSRNITFTKLTWSMLSTFFTSNLPKQAFLALIDNLIVRPNQPQFIMFILLGYISYNRQRILSLKSEHDLQTFLDQQHTVNTAKFMNHVFSYHQAYKSQMTYKFSVFDFDQRKYMQMNHYPKDAVAMYRGRRKLMTEEHRKQDQQQLYRDKLTNQMEKMTIKAKRNAQKQMIVAESFSYHVQRQGKSRNSDLGRQDRTRVRMQKIKRLQSLILQLTNALRNQMQAKNQYRQSNQLSKTTNLHEQSDRQLQELEFKLLKQLSAIRPDLKKPFTSIPVTGFKQVHNAPTDNSYTFKALMNAEKINKMWEIGELANKTQEKHWENEMGRSMKA